jgi:hypothetical protein
MVKNKEKKMKETGMETSMYHCKQTSLLLASAIAWQQGIL